MKPHKHAECIIAWAQGAEIEYREGEMYQWTTVAKPYWSEYTQYRIKPQPKVVKLYSFYDRIERALENGKDVNNILPQTMYEHQISNQPMLEWTFTDNKLTNVTMIGQ